MIQNSSRMRPKTYLLAKAIYERREILFGNIDVMCKPQALKEKEEAWEQVRLEMIDCGFSNFEKKSWKDVRNHDWQYLRRSAFAKYEHNQLVFEILGNEQMMASTSGSLHENNISNGYNQFSSLDFFNNSMELGTDIKFNDESSTNKKVENILAEIAGNKNDNIRPAPPLDSQQQLQNLLANVLTRKLSWDTNSSHEETNKDQNMTNPEMIIKANNNSLVTNNNKDMQPDKDLPPRKRPLMSTSSSINNIRFTLEEESIEVKTKLLRLQLQREETLLEIDKARLRQELLKVEKMEFELEQLKNIQT